MTRSVTTDYLTPLTASPKLPLIAALAVKVALVVTEWSYRRQSRKQLSQLDDFMLDDIGVTRHEAMKEANRPFWQA